MHVQAKAPQNLLSIYIISFRQALICVVFILKVILPSSIFFLCGGIAGYYFMCIWPRYSIRFGPAKAEPYSSNFCYTSSCGWLFIHKQIIVLEKTAGAFHVLMLRHHTICFLQGTGISFPLLFVCSHKTGEPVKPPPGTIMCICGMEERFCPQVCSTLIINLAVRPG